MPIKHLHYQTDLLQQAPQWELIAHPDKILNLEKKGWVVQKKDAILSDF
jgi:hypothetical protein